MDAVKPSEMTLIANTTSILKQPSSVYEKSLSAYVGKLIFARHCRDDRETSERDGLKCSTRLSPGESPTRMFLNFDVCQHTGTSWA